MNDTAPNVIVIPAKVETPQEQEKRRHLRVAAYPLFIQGCITET